MNQLIALTLADARAGLQAKKFSAVELADAHSAAIEKARALNAYVLATPERALAMISTVPAQVVVTFWPLARSNCGTRTR